MLDVLKSLRGLLKVQTINIDNNVSCLHYKFTSLVLLLCMLITSRQFFRESMECYFPDLPAVSLDTYCFVHSTFLVKDSASANAARKSLPYPGRSQHTEEDKLRFYDYYQWGFIILFLQAICFNLPHVESVGRWKNEDVGGEPHYSGSKRRMHQKEHGLIDRILG
ncbi:innexin inx2-like [Colias croceus]|uniref:innexin inx2-like n=1 Tax=Colias crocea TaxID=72248 RepID=UPI001E2810EE|nr:innexin inx2-like [Colias croceus]